MIRKPTETLSRLIDVENNGESCPACGLKMMFDFFEVEKIPLHVGVLWDTLAEAVQAPTGSITLAYCCGCGFIHNRCYEAAEISFDQGYEVALHHSKMFRTFMQGVAERLVERFCLYEKTIIEIGCGGGYFLRLLCNLGNNQGIGFDTSVPQEGHEQLDDGGSVLLVRDYYGKCYAGIEPDFICCLSVFEDIPQPATFLAELREMLADRPVGMYFEVFNAFRAFQAEETWSIHYEQCNYYSQQSFVGLFERNGFKVSDSGACYGKDQYLYVEAMPTGTGSACQTPVDTESAEIPAEVANFAELHRTKIADWQQRLTDMEQQGRRVVVWGSGGKGISFLNGVEACRSIQYVVDINPNRQNKFIPGSAQQVVAPEFLVEYRPDIVILTNVLYEQEIRRQLEELGITCEFQVA